MAVDLLYVAAGRTYRRRKKILHKPFHIETKYRQYNKFSKSLHFFEC